MNNTIYIIGTCHGDTAGFKVADLYQVLCDIQPELILDEGSIVYTLMGAHSGNNEKAFT